MAKSVLHLNANLSENIEYTATLLPIKACFCRQSQYAGSKAPCHWHSDIECIYVLEGSMTYYVNDMTYQISTGEGIFVNANRLHFCQCKPDEDCYYIVLLLSPSCLANTPKMEAAFVNPVIFENASDVIVMKPAGWQLDALNLIQKIFYSIRKDEEAYALTTMQDIYALWNLFYQEARSKHMTDKHAAKMDALKDMITYIQLHYHEKLHLSDIASSGMMCESKCCSLFKANLHQTPMAYLTAYRIRMSLNHLNNTTESITDIALACGFNSGSYYTETFQKLMKMTPKDYRKQNTATSA